MHCNRIRAPSGCGCWSGTAPYNTKRAKLRVANFFRASPRPRLFPIRKVADRVIDKTSRTKYDPCTTLGFRQEQIRIACIRYQLFDV